MLFSNIQRYLRLRNNGGTARPPSGHGDVAYDADYATTGRLTLTKATGDKEIVGNALESTPVGGVKAVKTLTGTATNVANGATVTVGSRVYTFQTTLTNVAGNVKIGASAAASLTNLFRAINAAGGTPGTDYALATTVHPDVVATNPTGTTLVITAKVAGTAGTAITTAETSAELSWANTTAGVNGTPAAKGDLRFDGTNFYFANADLTTASLTGWRKITHSAL